MKKKFHLEISSNIENGLLLKLELKQKNIFILPQMEVKTELNQY